MRKKILMVLSGLILSQVAIAKKPPIIQKSIDSRPHSSDQVGNPNSGVSQSSANLHDLRMKEIYEQQRASKEREAEKKQLIEKYYELAKAREYREAKEVAAILEKKFGYKVDLTLLEYKLSEEEIAKYQREYDYLLKSGDKESAVRLYNEVYEKYGVRLLTSIKTEPVRTKTVILDAKRQPPPVPTFQK